MDKLFILKELQSAHTKLTELLLSLNCDQSKQANTVVELSDQLTELALYINKEMK